MIGILIEYVNTSVLIFLQAERKFEQKDISGARKECISCNPWLLAAVVWITMCTLLLFVAAPAATIGYFLG